MKKLLLLFTITFLLSSCEKDYYLIPANEVPRWLKDRISHDEKIIQSDPQSGLDVAAWIRYKYEGDYYFEHRNGLSSLGPEQYDFDGNKYQPEDIFEYMENRCCKRFVWKGPNYIDY